MKFVFTLVFAAFLSSGASAQLVTPVWEINTVAGYGLPGYSGDGHAALAAYLDGPICVGIDSAGNFYILDYYNYRNRKVNTASVMTTVAGNGVSGNSGDNTIATNASMHPRGLAVDKLGNLFIADNGYNTIRKVDHTTNIITRYAGTGVGGYTGNGGSALSATFNMPYGLTVDARGDVFVADAGNHAIRKITPGGIISTVAGNDTGGYAGDGGLAIHAKLDSPYAVTVDRIGNIYISDHGNSVIRKVDTSGYISTFAGRGGIFSHTGDGGPANLATLNAPAGITIDSIGELYIADADNHVIRLVDTFGNISTIVGTGSEGYGGDLGPALGANLDNPYDVAVDKWGSIYIADANNQRIRKVYNAELGVGSVSKTPMYVYPNPFSNTITVSGLVKSDRVLVYDVAGREVDEHAATVDGIQSFSMPAALSAGIYVLQVYDASGGHKAMAELVKK